MGTIYGAASPWTKIKETYIVKRRSFTHGKVDGLEVDDVVQGGHGGVGSVKESL